MKKSRVAIICVLVTLLLIIVIGCVVFLLHNRNAGVVVDETVVEESSETETVSRGEMPRKPQEESFTDLYITVSEDASGARQGVMIEATEDYCREHDVVGNVIIMDADVDDDGNFTLIIDTESGEFTFTFALADYV